MLPFCLRVFVPSSFSRVLSISTNLTTDILRFADAANNAGTACEATPATVYGIGRISQLFVVTAVMKSVEVFARLPSIFCLVDAVSVLFFLRFLLLPGLTSSSLFTGEVR